MQISVNCFIYGAETFFSAKTQKNYHTLSLLVDGSSCRFFVDDETWAGFVKSKPFGAFDKSGAPTPAVILFDIRFTEKGVRADLAGVVE